MAKEDWFSAPLRNKAGKRIGKLVTLAWKNGPPEVMVLGDRYFVRYEDGYHEAEVHFLAASDVDLDRRPRRQKERG